MRPGPETAALYTAAVKRWGPRRKWRCVYCGRMATQVDHFQPEASGGKSDPSNLVPACAECNNEKQATPPVEWMKAASVPFERARVLWDIHVNDLDPPGWAELQALPRRPRDVPPACGTDSSYRRHLRRNEQCEVCREAHRREKAAWTARRRIAFSTSPEDITGES